jgi:methionine-rich copper-binding protein CopC
VIAGLIVAAVAVVAPVLAATPALAHAYLTSTSPADQAKLAAPPEQVTLTFNEPVTHVAVAVEGPDGNRWDVGDPQATVRTVVQALRPLGPAGDYHVNYRVVSVDGHTVQGSVVFTLTAAGPGSPAPQPSATAAVGGGNDSSDVAGASPLWPVILVALAIAAIVGGWMLVGRRRSTSGGNAEDGEG